jgi:nicotinamidase-related amidase
MNFLHALFLGGGFLLGLVLFAAMYMLRNMFLPTRGQRIAHYANPTRALLVMDIQESSGTRVTVTTPPPVTTPFGRMIYTVNLLIEVFAHAGLEVAYVRQVFTSNFITRLHGGRILAGRMTPRICRWVKIVNSNDFAKNRTDAFSNRQLEQFLVERQVNELYLVGLDAAFCVYYTALGALQRGYRVTVVTDGVMTGRNWERVLRNYRRKGIAIMDSQELLKTLAANAV